MKVWINGTAHGVSKTWLSAYVQEFVYRLNRRAHNHAGQLWSFVLRRVVRGPRRAWKLRDAEMEPRGVVVEGIVHPALTPRPSGPHAIDGRTGVERLYFHQLLVGPVALLDLGPSRFSGVDPLAWSPTWARHAWTEEFRAAVYDLYAGFYGDDDARFDAALTTLGLTPARAVFLAHFGGDQTAVRFSGVHFRQTFHAAFVACRDAGTQIHPDFLPMGLMLASLYAHLEALDVPLDVRAAWRDVASVAAIAA